MQISETECVAASIGLTLVVVQPATAASSMMRASASIGPRDIITTREDRAVAHGNRPFHVTAKRWLSAPWLEPVVSALCPWIGGYPGPYEGRGAPIEAAADCGPTNRLGQLNPCSSVSAP